MTARDRGHIEEIINHLKRVENDYRINLTSEMEWLRKLVKEEHVSDDLKKEIEQYCIHHGYLDSFKDCGYTFNEQVGDIARHFANWQEQQDDKILNEKQWEAWAKGGEEMKQELMKGVKNGVVCDGNDYIKFDDGTWIELDPTMQLNPAFALKDGDKVKVIVLKEKLL